MNRALKIISCALFVLFAGGFIAVFAWRASVQPLVFLPDGLLYAAFTILSVLTASGVHELGHAFFGLFTGMRAKLTVKSLLPSVKPSSVQIIPKKQNKIKIRFAATAFGGIFFNLLFIVFGATALFVPQIPIWLSSLALWHLSVFFDNVMPVRYASGETDMSVICGLAKNTPEAQVAVAVLTAQAHILGGESVGSLDKTVLFGLPQIAEDEPSFISLTELRAEYCEATGDEENAALYRSRLEQLKRDYCD